MICVKQDTHTHTHAWLDEEKLFSIYYPGALLLLPGCFSRYKPSRFPERDPARGGCRANSSGGCSGRRYGLFLSRLGEIGLMKMQPCPLNAVCWITPQIILLNPTSNETSRTSQILHRLFVKFFLHMFLL